MRVPVATLLWLLVVMAPLRAQPVAAVQLVLAVDASGSVDSARFELQKHGYAEAFRSPAVHAAIRATATGAIAVTMTQWTGPTMHVDMVNWTLVNDPQAANALADAIDAAPRVLFGGGTSISGAIDDAMALFPQSSWQAARKVIDVSGDGINNRGRPAEDARDAAIAAGVVINGLPILEREPDLDDYYRHSVIGGPGAFVIAVAHYAQFAAAIRNKLVVEIAGNRRRGPPTPEARQYTSAYR